MSEEQEKVHTSGLPQPVPSQLPHHSAHPVEEEIEGRPLIDTHNADQDR